MCKDCSDKTKGIQNNKDGAVKAVVVSEVITFVSFFSINLFKNRLRGQKDALQMMQHLLKMRY
jgi:hypothetical protein